ncbi:hypothetical protein DQ04_01421030 [Trypanosoma grayi]|uniref:hypothetical protein n=1 Tax=Trypanosoma grayi TaxID=71804 RepID=UPI0004F44091|nr:hypothetical protein DQ04_01421030 [Trypanosoma grayi]KEG12789.1 hypothetical protein DQ04_01421030 [Trypanosoma grayi]
MSIVQLSATGRVACDGSFLDMYGRRPAATIQAVHPTGTSSPPPLASWSAFATPKKVRAEADQRTDANAHVAGEHVALAFSQASSASSQELFFAVGVFRCDTWALQWAVRVDTVGHGHRVCEVCCLSAHTIVLLVEEDNRSKNAGSKCSRKLYIATKADVPRVTKSENRQWRSFLADARLVETGFGSEGLCGARALSATSCLLLTGSGRLVRVTLTHSPHVTVTTEEVALLDSSHIVPKKSAITACALAVSSTDGQSVDDPTYVAVFAADGSACHVVELPKNTTATTATKSSETPNASKPQMISMPAGMSVERVEFAGPHLLAVTVASQDRRTFALHFTCLVPSESPAGASFSCASFDPVPMTAHRVPLATMFNAESQTHVVLAERHRCHESGKGGGVNSSTSSNNKNNNNSNEEPWWGRVEYTELPLQEGPYTVDVLRTAVWHSLPEPFYTALPTAAEKTTGMADYSGSGDDDEGEDAAANYQQEVTRLLSHQQQHHSSIGHREPLRLHYALAMATSGEGKSDGKDDVVVNVLAIETAPFVHTRLVKQWHNATRGLRFLLDGDSYTVDGRAPFAVAWNPQHMRRALRLLSQDGLRLLFAKVADALRCSSRPDDAASLFYGASATAVTDVALQIVTLFRQVGAHLQQEDVAVVAQLLRASREAGHLILNHTTRGGLLLESAVRSRMAKRVLAGAKSRSNTDASDDGKEETEDDAAILNVQSTLHIERALYSRYATNAWAQQLFAKRSEHAAAVAGAIQHLKAVLPLLHQQEGREKEQKQAGDNEEGEESATGMAMLPDWVALGQRAHADAAFTEYESALLRPSKLSC